ncbi:MAG: ATPase domain-containing protein [Nanoarchaeota archaeon]
MPVKKKSVRNTGKASPKKPKLAVSKVKKTMKKTKASATKPKNKVIKKNLIKKPSIVPAKKEVLTKKNKILKKPKIDLTEIKNEVEGSLNKQQITPKTELNKKPETAVQKPIKEPVIIPAKELLKKPEENKQKKTETKAPIKKLKLDMKALRAEIDAELHGGIKQQIEEQRSPAEEAAKGIKGELLKRKKADTILTGVPGFDELFETGIPKGYSVLVAGGAGSGKTIFCLQTLMHHLAKGHKCFYMSFEESEERLIGHMAEFGWDVKKYIKEGKLIIKRFSPFEVSRTVEAMLEKEKGELLIDIDPLLLPKGFQPDIIALDSLTAIASAFTGKEDSYRIYIEQLFRFFEKLHSNAFLITETKQIPEIFSTTGVEEFLADGVIVFYNIKRGDIRENAIEVLKMRGSKHKKRIVAMQITDRGVVVYPEQEVFGGLGE